MTTALNDWLKLQSLTQQIDQELTAALQTLVDQISLNEFYVLHFLAQAEGQPLRVNDLSVKLGLSQSATSRMLTRFERTCEVIERQPSSVDKRSVLIHLTPAGWQYLQNAERVVAPILAKYHPVLERLTVLKGGNKHE